MIILLIKEVQRLAEFKLNVAVPKEGKTYTFEVKDPQAQVLVGKRIGDTVDGKMLGLKWKKLKITGGSDTSGFPMRPDIHGGVKKRVLLTKGLGLRTVPRKGYRKKKMIRGNMITPDIYQVNLVAVEE